MVLDAVRVEEILDVVVVHPTQRHEIALVLVLEDVRKKVLDLACVAEEHLALAVLHVFLDVEGYLLDHAEILHRLGNGDAHLLCQREEVVDGVARGEHHRSVVEKVDLLLAKLLGGYAVDPEERTEHTLHAKL